MKKLALFILLALAIQSCKTDPAKTNVSSESDVAKEEIPEEVQTIEWSRFTASGTEPSWAIAIDAANGELIYELSMNNGEITKIGSAEIVMINSSITSVQLDANEEIIQFQIMERSCTDNAGNAFAKSIFFTTGGQKYIGCGEFATKSN